MSRRELSDGNCGFPIVHQILQSSANARPQFLNPFNPSAKTLSDFSQQTFEIQLALFSIGGRFANAESWSQPTPEGRENQNLRTPAVDTFPGECVGGPAKMDSDDPGTLVQNAMPP